MDFEGPSSTTLDKNKLWAWHTDVDVFGFHKFLQRLNDIYGNDRTSLISDCFYHFIKAAHPYDRMWYADHTCKIVRYYNVLALEVNENTPANLRQDIITTLLNHINLSFYDPNTTDGNFLIVHSSICTLIRLKILLNSNLQQTLIQQAMIFMNLNLSSMVPPGNINNTLSLDLDKGNRKTYSTNILYVLKYLFDVMTPDFKFQYIDAHLNVIAFFDDFRTYERQGEDYFVMLLDIANKIPRCDFENNVLRSFSKNPVLKKALENKGYLKRLDLVSTKLNKAMALHPGTIDPTSIKTAFKLYSEIPSWSKVAFGEAQYWIANLICYYSNFTPEDFKTESKQNKKKRLLAMKPHLYAAALVGNELAQAEKLKLDEDLKNITIAIGLFHKRLVRSASFPEYKAINTHQNQM